MLERLACFYAVKFSHLVSCKTLLFGHFSYKVKQIIYPILYDTPKI